MYNAHFGFSESPFEVNSDQRFLYVYQDFTEILYALSYFVKERKGLALVTGEIGTGKTMLINSFLLQLPETVQPILISNPLVSYRELLHFIAGSLGISDKKENLLDLIEQIREVLLEGREQGKNFVLIVDEAHLLSIESLEQVRLLLNLEIPQGKLLQILLVGQYELTHKLVRPEMLQLRQRINISRFLSPLTQSETLDYIDHRLQKVGSQYLACFEPTCDRMLYQLTEGVPRRINQLCDNALLHCMAEGLNKVNRQVLQKAHDFLHTDVIMTPEAPSKTAEAKRKPSKLLILSAVCAALLFFAGILDYSGVLARFFKGRPALESVHLAGSTTPPSTSTPAKKDDVDAKQAKNTEVPQPEPDGTIQKDGPALNSNQPGPAEIEPPLAGSATEPQPEPDKIIQTDAPALNGDQSSPAEAKVEEPPGGSATADLRQHPKELKIQRGDTLTKIATKWYPKNVELGLVAILLANPETINADLISTGQTLNLPLIDPADRTIALRENLFYAFYDSYASMPTLQETLSWLGNQGVRYVVVNTKNGRGSVTHWVLIGGYENRDYVVKALQRSQANGGRQG